MVVVMSVQIEDSRGTTCMSRDSLEDRVATWARIATHRERVGACLYDGSDFCLNILQSLAHVSHYFDIAPISEFEMLEYVKI
jgi:hypothetical protein